MEQEKWWSTYLEEAGEKGIIQEVTVGQQYEVKDFREAAIDAALEAQKTREINLGDLVAARSHPLVCMVTAISDTAVIANDGQQDLTLQRDEIFDPNLALRLGVELKINKSSRAPN